MSRSIAMLVAAAVVALLAAAGVAAGAERDVYPGGSIQDAVDGAGEGDTIYVHAGTYVEGAMSAEAAPVEEWNKTFGGVYPDFAWSVQQTSDSGYILAGETSSYGAGSKDAWLIKTDANGNEQWNKTFGETNFDSARSVQQTLDGGYILTGLKDLYGANQGDIWLIKTDLNGNEQWSKTFGGTHSESSWSGHQTSDGGYILVGATASFGAGDFDFWLIKTDSNGGQQWSKTFGGTLEDFPFSVQQTLDGGYILAGRTMSYGIYNYYDAWLIKTDSSGIEQWSKTFGGTNLDTAGSVQQTLDGGYILAGRTRSFGAGDDDAWLIKTDSNGNEQWNNTFGRMNFDTTQSVQQTSDGGYILAVETGPSFFGNNDAWLIKTDSNGNEQWNNTFGGTCQDSALDLKQTSDGCYILTGKTKSYGAGYEDVWLIKVGGEPAEPRVHNINTGKNFTTIQAAIDDPDTHDGHTITVDAGTYVENVNVDKRLTLIGEGADVVTVRAEDASDHVFEVSADWVNISGFMVTGATHCSGIYLNNTNRCYISDNNASNNNHGIWLYSSSKNVLMDNTANSNNGCGIGMCYSRNNTLMDNIVDSNNDDGIYIDYNSNNNTLYHNNFFNNTQNAHDYGAHDSYTNQWDSGHPGGGNYYSDYTGTDTNRDGIGETIYNIPGGESVDRYPLTGIRWLPPEITRSRLGINTHWNHWAEDLSIYEQKIKGFGVVRDQAWWAGLETTDLAGSEWDHANWDYSYSTKTLCGKEITYQSGLDNLVKLYQDEDSPELLLLLNLKNDNVSSFDAITALQYYDYVYHVVERYDRDGIRDMPGLIRPVKYFEVGNEVDYIRTNDSRHGYLSPEDYVEKRLIPAYNAAKAANKDTIVMGSGLGMGSDLCGNDGHEFNTMYLDAMYDNITANGGNKNNNFYMDKIAIHYYAKPNAEFDENIKKVEDVIRKYENRDKPIWITEFYPLTEIGPPDTTTGAFARLLALIFANRIEMPMIYNLKDDSESGFGLYNVTCKGTEETITPRDSIQVIDTVLSTLHGTTPSENETTSPEPGKTIYKRVFNNSDKEVTVLWYIDDADSGVVTNYNYTASPESPQTFTVDVLGTANFSQTSPLTLTVGSEPTYVVEADLPIDVDLYFNKTTAAGVTTERAISFRVGDTLYGKIATSTSTNHTVKTYITMTMPDGTCRYAHLQVRAL